MVIRWWIKYGRIKTVDPDFKSASKTAILVSVVSAIVLFVLHVNLFGLTL
jgi:hypothetical protein